MFLGPPGTGTAPCSPPPRNGSPASPRPSTPAACRTNSLSSVVPLLIIGEVGYILFETEAANLSFQLVSSRYERASLIVTSNKPVDCWGSLR